MTLDARINKMKNGQIIKLGGNDKTWTTVEKSGNGKIIRFVRHTQDGWKVFRTAKA